MLVEPRCYLVLGVDYQGEGGNLRTGGTMERISQQRTATTLPHKFLIDG
jgi:hypothetical protein